MNRLYNSVVVVFLCLASRGLIASEKLENTVKKSEGGMLAQVLSPSTLTPFDIMLRNYSLFYVSAFPISSLGSAVVAYTPKKIFHRDEIFSQLNWKVWNGLWRSQLVTFPAALLTTIAWQAYCGNRPTSEWRRCNDNDKS